MPRLSAENAESLVKLRHEEWASHQQTWRFLLDSYEGGERYRNAVYGLDYRGYPTRNLIRHKHEYPDPRDPAAASGLAGFPAGTSQAGIQAGSNPDANQYANVDDYELRRARTPVPNFFAEQVETHLAKIYGQEVKREGPDEVVAWWADVDGRGTAADDWFPHEAGPVFLALGQLDLIADHPPAPEGAEVRTQADVNRLGLGKAVVSYILPENLLWWRLLPDGRYSEALLLEYDESAEPPPNPKAVPPGALGQHPYLGRKLDHRDRYRYWTAADWTLLDHLGEIVDFGTHPFGRVPIERVFGRRKVRERNCGQSSYEATAGLQREYYNRDSELILSDTLQAHPLLQGPEDYVQEDGTVPIGPGWLLPKKKSTSGTSVSYEGFDVVEFPKGGAESIRQNKLDLRDEADRAGKMTKPAGATGTTKGTVAQSGISKQLDQTDGHELMGRHARALARLEMAAARLALTVIHDGDAARVEADLDAIELVYPTEFDLDDADDLAKGLTDFQVLLVGAGHAPIVETSWLQKLVRVRLKGRSQETYELMDDEIEKAVSALAATIGQQDEAIERLQRAATPPDPAGASDGAADEPQGTPNYNPYPLRSGL